jgi:hypothetical protein
MTSSKDLRRLSVETRANFRCEYCRKPQPITGITFHIEHIIPISREGGNNLENLALSCPSCNYKKQDHVNAIDPKTKETTPLFHPRIHYWKDHFSWSNGKLVIIGKTKIGRATIKLLDLNSSSQKKFRHLWKNYFSDLFPFE